VDQLNPDEQSTGKLTVIHLVNTQGYNSNYISTEEMIICIAIQYLIGKES
jgi:hypothetical protein